MQWPYERLLSRKPFIDAPICFPQATGPAYCPRNYDGLKSMALSKCVSIRQFFKYPAVQMLKLNGVVEAMIKQANAMGLET